MGGRWARTLIAAAGAALVAASPPASAAQSERWEQWQRLPGVFDIVGPRTDGRLVAAGSGRLFLVAADGRTTPFADGPGGYQTDAGLENYIAMSPRLDVAGAGCAFPPDEVYALELAAPMRIIRIDGTGRAATFVDLPGTDFLAGLTFDTVGRFGNRLLVPVRRSGGKASVLAIDCRAQVTTVLDDGPIVEGGIAVAPATFGRFGGALIGPDEHGGDLVAFRADGTTEVVARPNLAVGADVGVESLGFVPAGFFPDGVAYVADRVSPGAPTLGTDTILRLTADALRRAGVREGDLLVSTESVGRTVAVRCEATCTVLAVAEASEAAHIEGHLTAVAGPAPAVTTTTGAGAAADDGGTAAWPIVAAAGLVLVAAGLAIALAARRRRSS